MSSAVGIILIVCGLIATIAGVAGGVTAMFIEIRRRLNEERSFAVDALPTQFVEALTEFVKALIAAPLWLALIVIGLVLIAIGGAFL